MIAPLFSKLDIVPQLKHFVGLGGFKGLEEYSLLRIIARFHYSLHYTFLRAPSAYVTREGGNEVMCHNSKPRYNYLLRPNIPHLGGRACLGLLWYAFELWLALSRCFLKPATAPADIVTLQSSHWTKCWMSYQRLASRYWSAMIEPTWVCIVVDKAMKQVIRVCFMVCLQIGVEMEAHWLDDIAWLATDLTRAIDIFLCDLHVGFSVQADWTLDEVMLSNPGWCGLEECF